MKCSYLLWIHQHYNAGQYDKPIIIFNVMDNK